MKRPLIIYLSLTLLVFGAGYLVFGRLVADAPGAQGAPNAPAPEPAASDEPEPPSQQSLLVESVQGRVERSSIADADWTLVAPGNALFADERLRTDKDASVKLQADDESKIELDGQSEISIQEITATVHRIRLELGRLDVDYGRTENRRLRITSDAEGVFAETEAGRFVIQRSKGAVSVATQAGEVTLSSSNSAVSVGPGTLSYAADGSPPSSPEPIPLGVMLRVANPEKRRQREKNTTIRGRTVAAARVHVNDIPADVDKDGRFNVTVPLDPGRNEIQVVATTVYGRAEKALTAITVTDSVYTKKPDSTVVESAEVRWGTKKRRRTSTRNANEK